MLELDPFEKDVPLEAGTGAPFPWPKMIPLELGFDRGDCLLLLLPMPLGFLNVGLLKNVVALLAALLLFVVLGNTGVGWIGLPPCKRRS